MMIEIYRMLARYNAWANTRVYDAAASLSDADYRADHGAFFGSLHRTLNHLIVADRAWMKRFTGVGDPPLALDAVPYDDFASLRAARVAEDARICDWLDGMDDADLSATFTYRSVVNPMDVTQPFAPALSHFFNHQTHHRGQAHTILTRITGDAPSLDLVYFQRQTGIGLA